MTDERVEYILNLSKKVGKIIDGENFTDISIALSVILKSMEHRAPGLLENTTNLLDKVFDKMNPNKNSGHTDD